MQVNIGIKPENLSAVAQSLGRILADEYVLYTKTRKAHWYVTGPDFLSKHLFFEKQYGELSELIDSIAERIRSLGHFPPASLSEVISLSHLSEKYKGTTKSADLISALLADHESILLHMRENIDHYTTALHDAGTGDYITGLMEMHEKMAWMLRAHLE